MRLGGEEFVRRYLLHILPKGLMRIRHFGYLANRCRQTKLDQIRIALAIAEESPADKEGPPATGKIDYPCKQCRRGRLYLVGEILPTGIATAPPFR